MGNFMAAGVEIEFSSSKVFAVFALAYDDKLKAKSGVALKSIRAIRRLGLQVRSPWTGRRRLGGQS